MNRIERAAQGNASVPVAAVGVTVVFWGLVSPLLKYASLSGPALGFYRLWLGVAILMLVLRAGRSTITSATWRWGAIAGVIFGLNMLAFLVAVKMTTVANVTLIGALQPAIVILVAGRWFGETVSRREVACVAVAITGVAIVIVGSAGAPEWNPVGDAIAVGSVLAYTAYFLISKQARATVATLEYMTIVHLAAAMIMTPIALADPAELVAFDLVDLLIVLFFALVSGTAGQVVIGWAHRYVDVSLSSLIMLAVPAVAAVTAWPLLGEALGPVQIAGGVITLAAIGAMIRRPAGALSGEAHPAASLVTE
jgi:drug/metabolite transporter (DMT)-like permease